MIVLPLRRFRIRREKNKSIKAMPLNKIFIVGAALLVVTTGCKRKEKVLDVKTPAGGIEVERDKDTGAVDIKIDEKK